ncbi:MAG: DUF1080 domain-containing protein [Gemmataceae bacterium]|nr:DUF1080 domain-containing protein [Gemmataceae bacterium]
MTRTLKKPAALLFGLALIIMVQQALAQRYLSGILWPEPPVVTPGDNHSAPSDAIVLFDGKNFDAWKGAEKWSVEPDGGFTVKGAIQTKQGFGDCQLHLEFASPKEVKSSGQGRGNNGIGFMSALYEIQVLDSYNNKTYPEGQCASVYNQTPPMVNASRKPGEWQSLDITFTAPRFDADGKVSKPAYFTVLHNNILVHNHTEVAGRTYYDQENVYKKHADKLPIVLMYHGDPVRFRNIWLREFKALEGKPGGKKGKEG